MPVRPVPSLFLAISLLLLALPGMTEAANRVGPVGPLCDPGGKFTHATGPGNGTVHRISKSTPLSQVNKLKLKPGDSVLFERGGTWKGPLIVSSSGTVDNPIYYGSYGSGPKPKIIGQNGYKGNHGGVHIKGKTGIVVDGFEITNIKNGVQVLSRSSGITIQNMHVHHTAEFGLKARTGSNFVIFQNNEVHDTGLGPGGGSGFYIGTDPKWATRPDRSGYPDDTHNILIRGNYIRNPGSEGIEFKNTVRNGTIENNLVVNSPEDNGSIHVREADGVFGNHIIRNNEIRDSHDGYGGAMFIKAAATVTGNKADGKINTRHPDINKKNYTGASGAPCSGGGAGSTAPAPAPALEPDPSSIPDR